MSVIKKKAKAGLLGTLKAVFATAKSEVMLAIGAANLLILGLFNSVLPDYTAIGAFTNSLSVNGFVHSTSSGLFALVVVMLVLTVYMMWTAYDVMGKVGLGALALILGSLAFWAFTLGAFEGFSAVGIVTLVQVAVGIIIGFGFVAARLHRRATGQGAIAGDVEVIVEE